MSQATVSEVKDLMKKKNVKDEPGMTLRSGERSDPQTAKEDQKATRLEESRHMLSS